MGGRAREVGRVDGRRTRAARCGETRRLFCVCVRAHGCVSAHVCVGVCAHVGACVCACQRGEAVNVQVWGMQVWQTLWL